MNKPSITRKKHKFVLIHTRRNVLLIILDYCNAVLANLPDTALASLQPAGAYTVARFVAAIGPRDHVTPTLISLHWLPVRTNHLQTVQHDACCVLWSGSIVYMTLSLHKITTVWTYAE